jgi:hypothetical protein
MIGNAINSRLGEPIDPNSVDAITTLYEPAPEIFLAASACMLLIFGLIPLLKRVTKKATIE